MNQSTAPLRLDPDRAGRLMKRATYASTGVAVVLIAAKLVAWLMSDSVSILATLVDSLLDALASLINLIAVRHALTPADKEHRFGHGKAEALAGLGQAVFITTSGGFLLFEAVQRLISPVALQAVPAGMAVMVLSIVATAALLAYQRHVIRLTDSTAIKADALHYRTDLLVNFSVIVALLLSSLGWPAFDALFGIGIGLFILYSAWEIINHAADHLMDRELPDEERAAIKTIVHQHPQVLGMHDLRTRRSGTATFIQLHVELDDHLSLLAAHAISDQVEAAVLAAFPGSEVIIHLDPISVVKT